MSRASARIVGALAHREGDVPRNRAALRADVVRRGVLLALRHADELRGAHGNRTRGKLERLAGAGGAVRARTAHLDGRVRGGHLHLRAGEARERLRGEGRVGKLERHRRGCAHRALGVVGLGLGAEDDARHVALLVQGEASQKPRGLSDADHHDARGERVKRAGVAHAALPHQAAHARHHVVRRAANRLVHGDEAVVRRGSLPCHRFSFFV